MPRYTYGPDVEARVKRLLEALLSFVNGEFDESSFDIEFKWEAEDSANPKLKVKTTLVVLEWLTAKDKYPDKLTKPQIRQALKLLDKENKKGLLKILEDNRTKTQGDDTWHFTLTLWSKDKEKNIKQFEQAWKDSRPEKSKALEASFKKSEVSPEALQDEIDWQDGCQRMLPTALSINPLLHGDGVVLTIEDIVPLELVERKQRPQQKEDFSPEHFQVQASTEYETPVEHNKFLAQVLEMSNSLKNRDRKIAIIGEPGAGKTTLLQEIAKEVEGVGGLPIFVKLADLGEKTLKDYLLEDWLEEATGKRRISDDIQDDFVQQFNLGRVWLLLDGVDEIAATGNLLSSIEKQLKGWVADARIVLTCRLNVWDVGKNDLYSFDKYRIQQLSYPDMVDKFIRRFFFKAGESTKGEKLIEKLERSQPRIRDLIKNPLRLTLVCRTWKRRREQEELPRTKAELYKQFVETFYEWKDKPEIDQEKRPLLEQALRELAKNAIDKETTKFRLRESFVRQELDKFDKSLFDLACRVSWINNVGVAAENPDEPVYAFFHPTFQEYFAALAIDDWDFFLPRSHDNRNHKPVSDRYRIFEPQWKEVILLWLGREEVATEQKEEFIKALVEFEDGCGGFYRFRAYFLAASGIAEFWDCPWADEIVGKLVKWGFGYFNFKKQNWQRFNQKIAQGARAVLQETDRTRAITALVKLLPTMVKLLPTSQHSYILWQAAESLRRLDQDNSESLQTLIKLVQTTEDEFVRLNAVESLGKIDKDNSIVLLTLIELVQNDKRQGIRHLAIPKFLVIARDNPEGLAALIKLVQTSKDKFIRRQAIASLGELAKNDPDAFAALIELVQTSEFEDDETRGEAAASLGEIAKDNSKALTVLIKLVQTSEDSSTRRQAVASLGEIAKDNPKALTVLIELVQTSEDSSTRRQAVASLGLICKNSSEALTALIWLVQNAEDSSTRWRAVASLERMAKDNPEAVQALIRLIDTAKDKFTCRIAVAGLGKIAQDNQEALTALTRLMQTSEDKSIRWQTAASLVEIDNNHPEAIATLIRLVQTSEDDYPHWLATVSLGQIAKGNPEAIAALTRLVRTADSLIRRYAAESLGQIGKKGDLEAIAALIRLVQTTEDKFTCQEATYSLTKNIQGDALRLAVSGLKSSLAAQVKEKEFWRYKACYTILWHCAQNITYPAFYQAWHQHETVDNTTTSLSQNLNLADLPQSLQSAITNDPQLSQTIHLICIDGSQFIEPDRPAAKIYAEMVKRGCPKCDDGIPKTMAQLQIYWDLLESDKRVVLVFYASSTEPYSETFLKDLSKFGGAICVVTSPPTPLDPPLPPLKRGVKEGSKSNSGSPSSFQGEGVRGWGSLQLFAPSQAIADVVKWIQETVIEE